MENKLFFFILVQNKRAFCQNNMFKEERQNAWLYQQVDRNMYRLNKDINMVYKSLVHKKYISCNKLKRFK